MNKIYRITCTTDPFNASRTAVYKDKEVIEWNGMTPTTWVHDDNFGEGYTINEAREILMDIAREYRDRSGEPIDHKFFEMSYRRDIWFYKIEEFTSAEEE